MKTLALGLLLLTLSACVVVPICPFQPHCPEKENS